MEYNEIITSATAYTGLICPKCASNSFRRYGHCNGIQRFRCKKCGRCFIETVNTPLHGIHNKQKMIQYTGALIGHMSIRKAAMEFGISIKTSFAWRHKILSSFITLKSEPTGSPAGICMISMPRSYKGKRAAPEQISQHAKSVLATSSRGIHCLQLLPAGCKTGNTAKILSSNLPSHTPVAFRPIRILSRATYLAELTQVKHPSLNRKLVDRSASVVSKIDQWMERFHGVATKYLQQYWNWFRAELSIPSTESFSIECFAHRQLQQYRAIRSN